MKISLAVVCSLNGNITRGQEPDIYKWTSKEDAELFRELIRQHGVIVMGRKTYDAVRHKITPKPAKPRIVLTRTPEKYAAESMKGFLEFSSESPLQLVKRLEHEGFGTMLLVAGQEITTQFIQAGLVDELYLTLEPRVFGSGKNMVAGQLDIRLKLLAVRQLNEQGTLYAHYQVLHGPI